MSWPIRPVYCANYYHSRSLLELQPIHKANVFLNSPYCKMQGKKNMEYKKAEEEYCNGLANKEDRDYVVSTSDLAIMEQLRPDPSSAASLWVKHSAALPSICGGEGIRLNTISISNECHPRHGEPRHHSSSSFKPSFKTTKETWMKLHRKSTGNNYTNKRSTLTYSNKPTPTITINNQHHGRIVCYNRPGHAQFALERK